MRFPCSYLLSVPITMTEMQAAYLQTREASCFHPVLSKSPIALRVSIKASQLLGVLVLSSGKPAHEPFKS